jgi:hypothetical protein
MKAENVRLTEEQLTHGTARELLTLLRAISADGRLSDEEIQLLGDWLERTQEKDLPALKYLRVLVENVLRGRTVTETDRHDLVHAILNVMPEDLCREARLRFGCAARSAHGGIVEPRDDVPRLPVSEEQVLLMVVLGISVPEDCTYAQACELISRRLGCR